MEINCVRVGSTAESNGSVPGSNLNYLSLMTPFLKSGNYPLEAQLCGEMLCSSPHTFYRRCETTAEFTAANRQRTIANEGLLLCHFEILNATAQIDIESVFPRTSLEIYRAVTIDWKLQRRGIFQVTKSLWIALGDVRNGVLSSLFGGTAKGYYPMETFIKIVHARGTNNVFMGAPWAIRMHLPFSSSLAKKISFERIQNATFWYNEDRAVKSTYLVYHSFKKNSFDNYSFT